MMKLWGLWLCLIALNVSAEELPQELTMATDVGEVVLTIKDCDMPNNHGFIHSAYATEKYINTTGETKTHNGCWYKDHDIVNIWFYEEYDSPVATYKDHHFKPR